jgi:hypothetical protein
MQFYRCFGSPADAGQTIENELADRFESSQIVVIGIDHSHLKIVAEHRCEECTRTAAFKHISFQSRHSLGWKIISATV